MNNFELKRSDAAPRQFTTGAQRDNDNHKPRPDLLSPLALLRAGEWLRRGGERYGMRNWEKGIPVSEMYASAMRHLLKFGAGLRDEDHLAAVIFNIQAIMHFEETGRKDLDDMPEYMDELLGVPPPEIPEPPAVPEDAETANAPLAEMAEAQTVNPAVPVGILKIPGYGNIRLYDNNKEDRLYADDYFVADDDSLVKHIPIPNAPDTDKNPIDVTATQNWFRHFLSSAKTLLG